LSLRTVGTFAFDTRNRQDMLKLSNLHALLINIALRPELITASAAVRRESTRVLAILGENELVRQAARAPSITGRGVRILAMDGGGIRGRATVKLLKRIEVWLDFNYLNSTPKLIISIFESLGRNRASNS